MTSAAVAADHPRVPGFERFAANDKSPIDTGILLLSELNCTSCHAPDDELAKRLHPKQAPILDQVGARLRAEFIREYLLSPGTARPGSTMPHVLASLPEAQRQSAAEALTHFLADTGALSESPAIRSQVARGNQLFHTVGCLACHDAQRPDSTPLPGSVSLAHVARKYALPGLTKFLTNPLESRPSGRMPALNLKPEEARDIAAFLLKDLELLSNLRYSYYEGGFDKLPDFATLKPVQSGTTAGFDVNLGRTDQFAVRFEGTMQIDREGQYRFHLSSDDGSRLLIDGQLVVNNDNVHAAKNELGRAFLTAGRHAVVVEYFEQGGEESLKVEYEGSGVKLQSLESALVVIDERKPGARPARFAVDPVKVEQGRQLYATLRCGACHTLAGSTASASSAAPALNQLTGQGGCLAESPAPKVPHYALSAPQTRALRAAIDYVRQPAFAAETVEATIGRTLLALNCYACHERATRGGVVVERDAFFRSNQPEMGDEGRLPPHLNGIGAKLTRDWLRQVLENGTKDRPYMLTRMPKFGAANAGHLVAALEAADPEPRLAKVEPGVSSGQLKSVGRRLVGSQGYSCIKCHTWGNVPATGIQSISMTTMSRRLREAWFRDYVLDPIRYRPGTRMPAAWPMGQSLLPTLLGGDTPKQIYSVWSFLTDGDKASMPQGLGRDPIELLPITEPIIYRNFIDGGGPRAIGVGYPEKANLAFDANDLRIAMIWQGAFIDASRHWLDRGSGFQPPLGDNVVKLAPGPTIARLESAATAWPDKPARPLGYRFHGYRLNEQRQPVFRYSLDAIQVEDWPAPETAGETVGIRRELHVTTDGPNLDLYVLAAAGDQIKAVDGGWYQVDDTWKIRIAAPDAKPTIRRSGNRSELILPLSVGRPGATVTLHYAW